MINDIKTDILILHDIECVVYFGAIYEITQKTYMYNIHHKKYS